MSEVSLRTRLALAPTTDSTSQLMTLAMPVALGLLSLVITGFQYGVLNDVFHIPIIQHAYNWPQFTADPYYQDLRAYSSALWPALSIAGDAAASPQAFLLIFTAIRLLTFISLAFLLRKIKLSGKEQILTLLIVAASGNLLGLTLVGYQDMLVGYLDHTSIVWPLIFWSIGLACERRLAFATSITGLIFCANAFVAVWHALALALVMGGLTLNRSRGDPALTSSQALTKFVLGGLIAGAIAAPVLFWTVQGILSAPPFKTFSYKAFLWDYFPKHFLIQSATPLRLLSLGVVLVSGYGALRRLGAEARIVCLFVVGYVAVFGTGVVAPFLANSRLVLNLHLLRVDGCIVFLCVIAASALSARLILAGDTARSIVGLGALVGTAFAWASPLMLLVWTAKGIEPLRPEGRSVSGARASVLAMTAATLLAAAVWDIRSATPPNPDLRPEQELGAWLDLKTPVRTQILARTATNSASGLEELQLFSKRRVYVDWKRGATTMWRPDFYAYWRGRMNEVSNIKSVDAALSFACAHKLDLVVERNTGSPLPRGAALVHQNQTFSALRPLCGPSGRHG